MNRKRYVLRLGDCADVLATLPEASIDAVVCDPPYGLAFMGKAWDHGVPSADVWRAVLRVLKPGGHLLAFGGTRTYHRMACAIEDAGFEIRDQIGWVYGSGFPKSLDVSKAIDKAAGAEREVVGVAGKSGSARSCMAGDFAGGEYMETAPATDAAREWSGWGTALKPAWEPVVLARRPLAGTVAANVLAHGTGALNIAGCRVEYLSEADKSSATPQGKCTAKSGALAGGTQHVGERSEFARPEQLGRWPANLIHDGSDEVVALFPNEASRFFYCAKASKADRDDGCDALTPIHRPNDNKWTDQDYRVARGEHPPSAESGPRRNHHPTVKPTDLMRYLCRLVTPPGGVVLDPFMGSGSTGRGALLEGFRFIGIEREADYFAIAQARIEATYQKVQP